jgi:hypothetical protein
VENRKKDSCLGSWYKWEDEDIRKGCRRVNMVEYYVLMYENGTTRAVETVPGMEEGGGKGE